MASGKNPSAATGGNSEGGSPGGTIGGTTAKRAGVKARRQPGILQSYRNLQTEIHRVAKTLGTRMQRLEERLR
ncbi:MAG: hypothetical protein ACRD02_11475 [Acidimicrobiia bacterium]